MGQVNSIPTPHPAIQAFSNLPKEAIMSLWLSYNLNGEGWGFTREQFVNIFKEATFLQSNYRFSDDLLNSLFNAFDSDSNELVDALEVLVTIGLLSGQNTTDCDEMHY